MPPRKTKGRPAPAEAETHAVTAAKSPARATLVVKAPSMSSLPRDAPKLAAPAPALARRNNLLAAMLDTQRVDDAHSQTRAAVRRIVEETKEKDKETQRHLKRMLKLKPTPRIQGRAQDAFAQVKKMKRI